MEANYYHQVSEWEEEWREGGKEQSEHTQRNYVTIRGLSTSQMPDATDDLWQRQKDPVAHLKTHLSPFNSATSADNPIMGRVMQQSQ